MNKVLADGVGFEPTRRSHACRFSRPVPSTARPPIQLMKSMTQQGIKFCCTFQNRLLYLLLSHFVLIYQSNTPFGKAFFVCCSYISFSLCVNDNKEHKTVTEFEIFFSSLCPGIQTGFVVFPCLILPPLRADQGNFRTSDPLAYYKPLKQQLLGRSWPLKQFFTCVLIRLIARGRQIFFYIFGSTYSY